MIDIGTVDWDAFTLAKSGRSVKLLYKKEPVQFCTTSLYSPFGVKSVTKEWSTCTEYYIDCSVNNSSSESASTFREFIDKLDSKITELITENMNMFGTKNAVPSDDFVYQPMLRVNGTYPKLLRLQVNRDRNGNFETFVFDENKNKLKIGEDNIEETLTRGKVFKCIVECAKLWIYNGKAGSIWNIHQLKFSEINRQQKDNGEAQENGTSVKTMYNTLMID